MKEEQEKKKMASENNITCNIFQNLTRICREGIGCVKRAWITSKHGFVVEQVKLMVANISDDMSNKDDLYLFMSPKLMYRFQSAFFAGNNYGRPLVITDANGDIVIEEFGPKVTIHKTFGLTGNQMYLTPLSNLFYAFDEVTDADLWYERQYDRLLQSNK